MSDAQDDIRAASADSALRLQMLDGAAERIFGRKPALLVLAFAEGAEHFTALRITRDCPLKLAQVCNKNAQALMAEWEAAHAISRARGGGDDGDAP